jgi:hypothetical protein
MWTNFQVVMNGWPNNTVTVQPVGTTVGATCAQAPQG